jgi:hypothetical protein
MDYSHIERAVLGALLLDNQLWPQVSWLGGDDFSLQGNKIIFRAVADRLNADRPVDLITLCDELRRRNELEKVGDVSYISSLIDGLPERSNIQPWAQILKREAALRRIRDEGLAISIAAEAPDANVAALHGRLADLAQEQDNATSQIRSVADIPDICDCDIKPPQWLAEGLLPRGALILWAGSDGSAKTWLALALAAAVAQGSEFLDRQCVRSVAVYLDYENPGHEVQARVQKLCGPNPWLKIWGNWAAQAPPQIGDPLLLKFCKETQPLLVIDPLRLGHDFDENDATEMISVMRHLRSYVAAGATVVILHHVAKAEGSGYRGSSAIRGACDVAILQQMSGEGLISLKVQKNRFGERGSFNVQPDFEAGIFSSTDTPADTERRDVVGEMKDLIRANPGMTQEQIIKQVRVNKAKGCQMLRSNEGTLWLVEEGAHNRRCYFPIPSCSAVPMCSGTTRTLGTTEAAVPVVPHPLGWNNGTAQEYPN